MQLIHGLGPAMEIALARAGALVQQRQFEHAAHAFAEFRQTEPVQSGGSAQIL